MPAKIPNLLINGSSGIAVGMATNIPPHNLNEVVDGCLALLANQKAVVEDDLDLVIPPAASAAVSPVQEELPVVDDTPEAVIAPAGDDLPQLD